MSRATGIPWRTLEKCQTVEDDLVCLAANERGS